MPPPKDLGRDSVEGRRGEDNIVSPSSDTMPRIMGRARPGSRISSETNSGGHSPTISEATWSPPTPVQRRGSRFEERL